MEDKIRALKEETELLEETFRSDEPLTALPFNQFTETEWQNPRKALAPLIEGQKLKLSILEEALKEAIPNRVDTDLKSIIIEVATRKFYGSLKENKEVDLSRSFEEEGPFYFWEVRAFSHLPEAVRKRAVALRRKHSQMQKRYSILLKAIRICEEEKRDESAESTKLKKALAQVEKGPSLDSILSGANDSDFEPLKRVGKRMKKENDVNTSAEKPEHTKIATLEVQESSMHREKKRQEKIANASGYESVQSLNKSKRMMESFFKTPSRSRPETVRKKEAFKIGGKEVMTCPEDKRLVAKVGDIAQIDKELNLKPDFSRIQSEFATMMVTMRGSQGRSKSVILGRSREVFFVKYFAGAPATWARCPGYTLNYEAECEKLFGSEWQSLNIVTIRRKFLWFISDSDCPPYFGSFSPVSGLSGRNPFRRAADLDYSEFFDEGWEEEPDGESLSAADEDDDDNSLSDEDEAFIVDDGHLSEDEGINAEMDCEDGANSCGGDIQVAAPLPGQLDIGKIEGYMKSAIKPGQPVLFTTLGVSMPARKDWTRGDPAVLELLKAVPMSKHKIVLPNKF